MRLRPGYLTAARLFRAALATAAALAGCRPVENPSPGGSGAAIYHMHCARCHGAHGEGTPLALAASSRVRLDAGAPPGPPGPLTTAAIERIVRDGVPGTTMPPFASRLAPAEIAAVAAHVRTLSAPPGATGSR